ncbi:MAG: NADH:flavin oxidoreductase [Deltaproteobacteria bacterium]|nr:NADH:flavin oxidoreductase [Deltaproteobacteria bacterium]
MSRLFERSRLKTLELQNRFVRSATWDGMGTGDGGVTDKMIKSMVDLSKGGVGLIISGQAYVSPEGQASFLQLGVHKDDLVDGLKNLTGEVHEHEGKIVMQISHAGKFAAQKITGKIPLAVSCFEGSDQSGHRELTKNDIDELIRAFADAAGRAKKAGFDGVQLHSAHGYLLSQFLSPAFNHRQDEYGGVICNRTRIHREIIRAIREGAGEDYPVFIKMNCTDLFENGLSLSDAVKAGKIFEEAGIDAIELSGGSVIGGRIGYNSPCRTGVNSEEKEAYFKEYAKAFQEEMEIPLILVGGIRSFRTAEFLVDEGIVDYVSMCRPLIREPGLIRRWKAGDHRRSECVSDNLCFRPGLKGDGVYCLTKKRDEGK